MKNTIQILIVSLLLTSLTSLAETSSYFKKTEILFENGQLPLIEEIRNSAWAGRCFLKNNPNTPIPAGYIIRDKKKLPLETNEVDTTKEYEAYSYWDKNKKPDYFDHLSFTKIIEEIDPSQHLPFKLIKVEDNSLQIQLEKKIKSHLRTYENYLVEKIFREEIVGRNFIFPITEVACYYRRLN